MAAFLRKRGHWLGFGFIIIVLASAALAAILAGNRISSTELDRELSEMTGRRVDFTGEPKIRLFPALTVEFQDFSLHDWANASDQSPLLQTAATQISLSVWSALQGNIEITSVVLDKPLIRAKAENGNWQFPVSDQSRLAKLIGKLNPSEPRGQHATTLGEIQDSAFGKVEIKNGTIVFDRNEKDMVSALNGAMIWQKSSTHGELVATGIWRKETAKLELLTDNVAALMAGASTGFTAALESSPLTTRFKGAIRLQPSPFVEGTVDSEIASLTKAANWFGLKSAYPFSNLGLKLNSALKGDADKWQLEESQLTWGANKGTGGLIFQPNLTPPLLSGTLDFDDLDLALLTQFFRQEQKNDEAGRETTELEIGADLRISAKSASFGALQLNKVAASLQISKQADTLDIHDATAFGGTLQMALKSPKSADAKTELRILGSEIETKALAGLDAAFTALPQARGSISAILNGGKLGEPGFFEAAEGTVKMRLGTGTIPGLNANQIVKALRKGGFFPLAAEAPSMLSFSEINAEATLAQGTLQFNPLQIGLDEAAFNLSGAYSVKDRSIALSGTLDLEAGHPEAPNGTESLKVFFGGSLEAPLMSSLEGKP